MDYDELSWLGGLIVGILAGILGTSLFWTYLGLTNGF